MTNSNKKRQELKTQLSASKVTLLTIKLPLEHRKEGRKGVVETAKVP